MNSLLHDMLAHREWADATSVAALTAHDRARGDGAVIRRIHHTILVQRRFLALTGGLGDFELPSVDRFSTVADLVTHARATHDAEREFVSGLDESALGEIIEIPFPPPTPLRLARWQALAQSAMHSQHHRAQNATRLRELGGEPPTTDLILWYWLQRPAATWSVPA